MVSVKVLDKNNQAHLSWFFEGLEWIYHDIKNKSQSTKYKSVINLSIGFKRQRGLDFLDMCFGASGAVTVAAAGHENKDACTLAPASFQSVITVSMTDFTDRLYHSSNSSSSNTGPCVDILAPGVAIVSVSHDSNHEERTMTGTSQAAAYVSGVVAILLESMPDQPSTQSIKVKLQETATRNQTNAPLTNTKDFLLYTSCESRDTAWDFTQNSSICMPELFKKPPSKNPADNSRSIIDSVIIVAVFVFIFGLVLGAELLFRRQRRSADERRETLVEQKKVYIPSETKMDDILHM